MKKKFIIGVLFAFGFTPTLFGTAPTALDFEQNSAEAFKRKVEPVLDLSAERVNQMGFSELTLLYDNGQIHYAGEAKGGLPEGYGVSFGPDGTTSYSGEWQNGLPHGEGTLVVSGVTRYKGSWKDGKPSGEGKSYYPSGRTRYDGGWQNGQPHGVGHSYYPDGGVQYMGWWRNGVYADYGSLVFYGNAGIKYTYEGGFLGGFKHGKGIVYEGDGIDKRTLCRGEWFGGDRLDKNLSGK